MKKGLVLIAALLMATLFSTSAVRAQEAPKQGTTEQAPAPAEEKLPIVVTTEGVDQRAELAASVVKSVIAQLKSNETVVVTVDELNEGIDQNAPRTLNLRFVTTVDPADAKSSLLFLLIAVHEKGNYFSYYLGGGGRVLIPADFKNQAAIDEFANELIGYTVLGLAGYQELTPDTTAPATPPAKTKPTSNSTKA